MLQVSCLPLLLQSVISHAYQVGASDIHVIPQEVQYALYMRIDGAFCLHVHLEREKGLQLTQQIKVAADLDITHQAVAQDGSMIYRSPLSSSVTCDIRVSTFPTLYGEKVVIRLLKDKVHFTFHSLGFSSALIATITQLISQEQGCMIVAGPTGAGKTTSLYAMAQYAAHQGRNVVTLEDPIEYRMPFVTQTAVCSQVLPEGNNKMLISQALRALLRQDPDVIMVGEMRDQATAYGVVEAALTGHLVMSSVHAHSSLQTLTRLLEMGVEPYLLAGAITAVIAQRLFPLLCPDCTQQYTITVEEQRWWKQSNSGLVVPKKLSRALGCPECAYTGRKGRHAVHELLIVDTVIRSTLMTATHAAMPLDTKHLSSPSLLEEALLLVQEGKVTLEEVIKAGLYTMHQ